MEKQTKTTTATTQTKASKATASKKSKQAKKPAYVDSVQALRNKKPIKIDLPASVEFDSNGGIITADNVTAYGERIAVRALKTCITSGKGYTAESAKKARENGKNINASGNFNFIYGLYTGLIADITARKNDTARPLSDGYDIAQTATAFLCDYIGKNINDPADTDEKNKDGTPASILRACFRAVNRYIMGERQREYKRAYVDEQDENGNTLFYEIPDLWDTPTATDFKRVKQVIDALNLTAKQAQILGYRLRGLSVHQIAEKLQIHRKTLQEHIKAIQAKYTKAQTEN